MVASEFYAPGMVLIGSAVGAYAWISGADIVSLNDQYVHDFSAFMTAICLAFFLSYVFGTFWTITQWVGFVIYSRFGSIRLRYYKVNLP